MILSIVATNMYYYYQYLLNSDLGKLTLVDSGESKSDSFLEVNKVIKKGQIAILSAAAATSSYSIDNAWSVSDSSVCIVLTGISGQVGSGYYGNVKTWIVIPTTNDVTISGKFGYWSYVGGSYAIYDC